VTIHRIPVIDVRGPGTGPAPIIHALQCIGAACASQRAAHLAAHRTGEASFTCPNFRANDPTKCAKTCFLYPRLVRGGSWHFHQGIDVGGQEGVSKIISVTDGVVHFARNGPTSDGYTGYGKVVVVHSEPFYYMYAHCAEVFVSTGDPVQQQQVIATVGRTQYLRDGREHSDTMGPHLHFEVSNARYPVASGETSLDSPTTGARIDPRAHLESLRQWGPKKFYFPLISGGGGDNADANEISVESTQRLLDVTEHDNVGGYFPLGANNIWHGGVHLRADADALVRAPFDAKVVAVRLDPDPVRARGLFGSLNFVLLHHELPEHIATRMNDGRAPERESWRGAVGRYRGRTRRRREVANAPALVREIKQLLHQTGFYAPTDSALVDDGSTVDDAFLEAIVTLQSNYTRHPDGVVDVPGSTYARLRERADAIEREHERDAALARGERPPNPRMVYTLLMHLRPEPLEDSLVGRIPWLGRIELEPNDAEREREAAERAERAARREREVVEDGSDRTYALGGSVGPPARRRGPANIAADVTWVQRRLTRHGFYEGEADGLWSASVDAAVRGFQTEHVPWYSTHRVDASISASGMTQQRLAMTPAELETSEYDPDAARPGTLDRRFIGRATELDSETGIAKVVTGLDVAIFAGEPVWTAGVGLGFSAPAGSDDARGIASRGTDDAATGPMIHWEIFSEQALIGAWAQLDDDRDDDLAVDVPALINQAQSGSTSPPPFDEAYDPPEADPEAEPASEAPAEGEALAEDGVLSVAEIQAFYASDRCHALRNTQFRFHSEWALNLSNTVDALRELGWNTRGLAAALAPYMWWSKVGDSVPSSPLVWHYNPITFMDHYRQLFPQPPPTTPTPAPEPSTGTEADRCDEPERLTCE
jgi:hypothetical protein